MMNQDNSINNKYRVFQKSPTLRRETKYRKESFYLKENTIIDAIEKEDDYGVSVME